MHKNKNNWINKKAVRNKLQTTPPHARDVESIAKIEKEIIVFQVEQQQNKDDQWPKPPTLLSFPDDWFEQIKNGSNMIESHLKECGDLLAVPVPSNKYLKKVLREITFQLMVDEQFCSNV